jgi:hypothetical protein
MRPMLAVSAFIDQSNSRSGVQRMSTDTGSQPLRMCAVAGSLLK